MTQQDNCAQRYYRWRMVAAKKRYDCAPFHAGSKTALADKGFENDYSAHYRTACHVIAQTLKNDELKESADRERTEELRPDFLALAERWRIETQHLSIISKKISHPAYFDIVGMGPPVIPLILESLRDRPAYWFVALRALAKTDPAPQESTPATARDAWLEWGRRHGHFPSAAAAAL